MTRPQDLVLGPVRYGQQVAVRRYQRFAGRRRDPVVLMHGFLGFNHLGPLEYFGGVRETLALEGFHTYAPTVDPLNRLEYRAYEWLFGTAPLSDDIEACDRTYRPHGFAYRHLDPRWRPHLAEIYLRHRRPLHLITHSQGSLDARFLVSEKGLGTWRPFDDVRYDADLRTITVSDMVQSICTIAGPHNGMLYADDDEVSIWLLEEIMQPLFGRVVSALSHDRSDARQTVREFGRRYLLDFNRTHPDPDDVDLYSIAGVTNPYQVTFFLKPFYEQIRYNPRFERDDNDGLVPVSSAKWPVTDEDDLPRELEPRLADTGTVLAYPHQAEQHGRWRFLGLVYADHVDQIGMPVAIPRNHLFHHRRFYSGIARFLHGEFDDPPDGDPVTLLANGAWGRSPELTASRR